MILIKRILIKETGVLTIFLSLRTIVRNYYGTDFLSKENRNLRIEWAVGFRIWNFENVRECSNI